VVVNGSVRMLLWIFPLDTPSSVSRGTSLPAVDNAGLGDELKIERMPRPP